MTVAAWADEMAPTAYGLLALTPAAYEALTPGEFRALVVGAQWRQRRAWEQTAWLAAHLMNMSGKTSKRRFTVETLLGQDPDKKPQTWQEQRAIFRAAKAAAR